MVQNFQSLPSGPEKTSVSQLTLLLTNISMISMISFKLSE